MKKSGIVIIIISILIMVVALSTTVYAWFSLIEKTQKIIIYSGKIELVANLYDELDQEINSITIDKVVPGDVYHYSLVVKNEGTISGDLKVTFNFKATNSIKNYIIFTLAETTINFNHNNYVYEEQEIPKEATITINFSITISEDLELTHLSGNDEAEIESIVIDLVQAN